MPVWKRNLYVCWFGMFVCGVGISQIAPILPLYIKELGVTDTSRIAQLSGLAYGVTFFLGAVFAPIWGNEADRKGVKPIILRCSLGMSLAIGAMAFAPNVQVLIGLRALQGIINGFGNVCTMLIATQAAKEHAGWALGLLATASVSGQLLGPVIGGGLADFFDYRIAFLVMAALIFIAFLTSAVFIKEEHRPALRKRQSWREAWSAAGSRRLIVILFATHFVILLTVYSVQPMLTLYVSDLVGHSGRVALISGLVFSASGLATIMAAPYLGRVSDRVGARKVLLWSLLIAGLILIPHGLVRNVWELAGLRFLLGLTLGGLNPSINILLKQVTPDVLLGRVLGLSMSAGNMGIFIGSLSGGQITAAWGLNVVFIGGGALLLLNAVMIAVFLRREQSISGHDKGSGVRFQTK
ncbi:MAG: MFS transporter [Peptococcaceae bacterium]|jgi:MFS family permease|nr:MFS transporter [Peptococcaceae bacterium]